MSKPANTEAVAALLEPAAARQRHSFRVGLRSARAQVQADAEGFQVIVHQIERLGRHLVPKGAGLGDYTASLVELVKRGSSSNQAEQFRRRLFLLKESRNDAAHQGSHARHAALEAGDVALMLEEAMSPAWETLEARDVMVRNPVVAEPWHTLRDVRQQMLLHAFTCIPVESDGKWYLLRDSWLAWWVSRGSGNPRKATYRSTVAQVATHLGNPVETIAASAQLGGVDLLLLEHGLLLVHDERHPDHPLVGVIAASDLL